MQEEVVSILKSRLPAANPASVPSHRGSLPVFIRESVRDLVLHEKQLLDSDEAFKRASQALKDDPDATLHQLVLHFQNLFDVPQLQGVLPKMNEIYLFVNESLNHMRALRSILGVGKCLVTSSSDIFFQHR